MAEPLVPTPPKLTDPQKRAVAMAAAAGGLLYCAPKAASANPKARWNVCQRLVEMDLLAQRGNPVDNVWPFLLTGKGMARASAIAAEAQAAKVQP